MLIKKASRYWKLSVYTCRLVVSPLKKTLMARGYKYINKKWADTMLSTGNMRLGPLYGYWEMENKEMEDKEEGTREACFERDRIIIDQQADIPPALQGILNYPNGCTIELEGVSSKHPIIMPNLLIYCTTQEPNREAMERFECDCCIEISDMLAFQKELVDYLGQNRRNEFIGPVGAKDCDYTQGRRNDYDDFFASPSHGINTYWIKDERFSKQKEHRIIYPTIVKDDNLKHMDIDVPGIIPLISIYQF